MSQIMETIVGSPFLYFFIVVGIFAIGDFLGVLTKAKLSSVFVALVLFLIGFLTGVLPADIIERANLTEFAKLTSALLIFHMGTMINLKQLIAEWRTVVTAILSMVVVMVLMLAISPIIGFQNAIVSIPVLNGGLIATQIMSDKAMELGFTVSAALATIVYATQKFAGSYPASFFGVREARNIVEEYRQNKKAVDNNETATTEAQVKTFAIKNNKYFTDFICIAISAFFALIATVLGKVTPINMSIWALLFGAIVGYLGLVPVKILEKGKASGLLSMVVFATLIPSLAKISVNDLISLGMLTLLILAVTVIGLIIAFYVLPLWKISKSKNLAVGIAMGQLLGFPATFLIANEIAKAVTDNEDEQQAILEKILPAYVVAGITTVTVLSIVIAGIFANFL